MKTILLLCLGLTCVLGNEINPKLLEAYQKSKAKDQAYYLNYSQNDNSLTKESNVKKDSIVDKYNKYNDKYKNAKKTVDKIKNNKLYKKIF